VDKSGPFTFSFSQFDAALIPNSYKSEFDTSSNQAGYRYSDARLYLVKMIDGMNFIENGKIVNLDV
jgi:hypothetical protein